MRKNDVVIGSDYVVKVSGKICVVRITGPCSYGGWYGINRKTKRQIRIKTASRLRLRLS